MRFQNCTRKEKNRFENDRLNQENASRVTADQESQLVALILETFILGSKEFPKSSKESTEAAGRRLTRLAKLTPQRWSS